ncbi:1,4-alpha-glucan branching protein GlgB [bacterium]|nr:1,4-alpha-glucan branching protein GlgB [bacterium]
MTAAVDSVKHRVSLLSEDDIYLFNEGNHVKLYDKLGSHLYNDGKNDGVYFAVWAPDAAAVSVIGEFNDWNKDSHHLSMRGQSGIWEGFIPGLGKMTHYKYHIRSRYRGYEVDKADPYAIHAETPPRTASIVWDLDYEWGDGDWMRDRHRNNALDAPISIYEMHVGSWRRVPEDGNRSLSYRELAPQLAAYLKHMGYTHVEMMPVMEHPFFGSWGYQTTGYFAPSSRYGTPQDFMFLVDYLHQAGIGVILDWVPSHFPSDEFGLAYFDGTHLYEHKDPRQGLQRDWNSYIFNFGRNEVRAFLISSALYWLEKYHVDGIRVDAVASMLYLDYSRKPGEWVPNRFGGHEHLEAIDFLRKLNTEIYQRHPDVQTFAEESTAWPMVARPTYVGGLGFGLKWDMGWMHDTLDYMSKDPIFRKFHHHKLTFRMLYAFSENFVLPLSHDEVVYGKGSLLRKMPGDDWQKFANLRLLFAYMYAQPAKKLMFMGGEIGQWNEWQHDLSLDWHLLGDHRHNTLNQFVRDLNMLYRNEPAMHEIEFSFDGFSWIDCNDNESSVISLVRRGKSGDDGAVVAAFNFTPVPRLNYRIGVSRCGRWRELLNSDALEYGGAGFGNMGEVEAVPQPSHNYPCSLNLVLPPLGAVFLKQE